MRLGQPERWTGRPGTVSVPTAQSTLAVDFESASDCLQLLTCNNRDLTSQFRESDALAPVRCRLQRPCSANATLRANFNTVRLQVNFQLPSGGHLAGMLNVMSDGCWKRCSMRW